MAGKNHFFDLYSEAESTEKYFYLHNGIPLKSIPELIDQLVKMNQELFDYHVNKDHNDFANWVRDVFGNRELARRINLTRTPKGMMDSITKYFES